MNKTLAVGILLSLFVTGCQKSDPAPITPVANVPAVEAPAIKAVAPVLNFKASAEQFLALAQSQTQAMLTACASLQIDIQSFLAAPTTASQAQARESYTPCYQAWVASALFFQQPFNFSEQTEFNKLVDLIDTRPFLPGYIDGIPEYPFSGLIHELDLKINADTLRSQHRLMDEESASLGFPVIEFFLWKVPTEAYWSTNSSVESREIIERRHDYLTIATTLLLEQLSKAVLRWQTSGEFNQLPESAQQSFVLKSLQRQLMIDMLANLFEEAAITEPEWHHPAIISGQGRQYVEVQLATLQQLFNSESDNAFIARLNDALALPFNADELIQTLASTQAAVANLPENYPAQTEADDTWKAAQQQVAALALMFSQLSEHFGVAQVTE